MISFLYSLCSKHGERFFVNDDTLFLNTPSFRCAAFRCGYPTKNWEPWRNTTAVSKHCGDYLFTSAWWMRLCHHPLISKVFSQISHLIWRCWVNYAYRIKKKFHLASTWPPIMFIKFCRCGCTKPLPRLASWPSPCGCFMGLRISLAFWLFHVGLASLAFWILHARLSSLAFCFFYTELSSLAFLIFYVGLSSLTFQFLYARLNSLSFWYFTLSWIASHLALLYWAK